MIAHSEQCVVRRSPDRREWGNRRSQKECIENERRQADTERGNDPARAVEVRSQPGAPPECGQQHSTSDCGQRNRRENGQHCGREDLQLVVGNIWTHFEQVVHRHGHQCREEGARKGSLSNPGRSVAGVDGTLQGVRGERERQQRQRFDAREDRDRANDARSRAQSGRALGQARGQQGKHGPDRKLCQRLAQRDALDPHLCRIGGKQQRGGKSDATGSEAAQQQIEHRGRQSSEQRVQAQNRADVDAALRLREPDGVLRRELHDESLCRAENAGKPPFSLGERRAERSLGGLHSRRIERRRDLEGARSCNRKCVMEVDALIAADQKRLGGHGSAPGQRRHQQCREQPAFHAAFTGREPDRPQQRGCTNDEGQPAKCAEDARGKQARHRRDKQNR